MISYWDWLHIRNAFFKPRYTSTVDFSVLMFVLFLFIGTILILVEDTKIRSFFLGFFLGCLLGLLVLQIIHRR